MYDRPPQLKPAISAVAVNSLPCIQSDVEALGEDKHASIQPYAVVIYQFAANDSENPHNWSTLKKALVAALICVYTFVVYLGSSICFGSILIIEAEYGVSDTAASLVISVYVLGYGAGALLFSPLSEIPALGRNPPYLVSFALFLLFSAVVATSKSFTTLLVARFMQGFMGSPALATGAASMQDIFDVQFLPFAFAGWMGAATLGPAFGPMISIYTVTFRSWRWPFWELLCAGAVVMLLMLAALPETSTVKILYDKGKRLNVESSRPQITAPPISGSRVVGTLKRVLYTPTKIMLTHPGVLFANVYTCIIYALYYTYFDSFPLIYLNIYDFDYQELGLAFLAITLGTIIGTVAFLPWAYSWVQAAKTVSPYTRPERCLVPGLCATFLIPTGLLIFAWTSTPSIHWAVGLSGIALFTAGIIIILQCLANYLILIYPSDAASLFAGNDFMRASLAAGAVVFSRPLYQHLGVAKGVSVLAASTVLCIGGMFALYHFGEYFRMRAGIQATSPNWSNSLPATSKSTSTQGQDHRLSIRHASSTSFERSDASSVVEESCCKITEKDMFDMITKCE